VHIFIAFIIISGLWAGDEVVIPEAAKPDLNKIVRLFIYQGIPGRVSQDGGEFATVHRGVKMSAGEGGGNVQAAVIQLPYWLTRYLPLESRLVMNATQQKLLADFDTEVAVWLPLAGKHNQLQNAVSAAVLANKATQKRVSESYDKARKNNDAAALSDAARRSRATISEAAVASMQRAGAALSEWRGGPDYAQMMFAQNRVTALWGTVIDQFDRQAVVPTKGSVTEAVGAGK